MSHPIRWWTAVATAALLAGAAPAQDKAAPAQDKADGPDARVYANLRDVINRGVTLYNSGEHTACYRLFQGSLLTLRPLIDGKPELLKAVNAGLANAERDPVVWRRAFTLRSVLDKVRTELNPRKGETPKLPAPKPEEKKPEEKKPEPKKPEPKKPDEQPAELLGNPRPYRR
jgi:hypothetical protein